MKRRNQKKPSPFPGQMSLEVTKPGFSFFVFILCCSTFLLIDKVCVFVVLGLVFTYVPREIGLGNVSEMTRFVSIGT